RLAVSQSGNLGISSCQVASAPIDINIIRVPAPGVTITDSSSAVCAGMPVYFAATPSDGGVKPSYQWTVDGQPAGNGTAYFDSSFAAGGEVVACTMTSNAVCAVNPVVQSNTLALSVIAIPPTGVTIASSAVKVCQDSLVIFTASPIDGGPAPGYQWQV